MGSVGKTKSFEEKVNERFATPKEWRNRIDKATFKDQGGGQWTLDTGWGGAQILDESDGAAGGYGRMKAYSVKAWDSNYDVIGDTEIYSSLNAAKKAAKKKLKSTV